HSPFRVAGDACSEGIALGLPRSIPMRMATQLENYGLIGDLYTIALVSRTGSIDWLCLPRIDSDACFAQLLGSNSHGYWSIRPSTGVRGVNQHYRPDTLILETDLACEGGRVRIIDFMPMAAAHDIIRIVEGLEGEVPMHCDLSPRFAYGKLSPWIRMKGREATFTSGPDALVVISPVSMEADFANGRVEANFVVHKGQRPRVLREYFPSHEPSPKPVDPEEALVETERFWREWTGRCRYQGRWRDAVIRSLVTLKALTYSPTGGICAAATTSLPEELQG